MAAACPEDTELEIVSEYDYSSRRKGPSSISTGTSSLSENSFETLTAEFRHRIGILDEDADITDAFKASIGILGPEGVKSVDEITWRVDEERDQTISRFKFSKFVKESFTKGHDGNWTKGTISGPLIPKKHKVDEMASVAVFVAIQIFMGDRPKPETAKSRTKTPVMTKIYRTLEKFHKQNKHKANAAPSERKEEHNDRKRSSWKRIFKRTPSEKSKDPEQGVGKTSANNHGAVDLRLMIENIPLDELDVVHYIIGHGILRRDLRDEILCQLCKQLTNNSNVKSRHNGWILIALCCGSFLPSEKLSKYFRCFLKDVDLDHKDYAGYSRRMLRRVETSGIRFHPPNWLELQATKMKKYCLLPVSFADKRIETVEADAATTAGEILTKLNRRLGISDDFGFSVFISIYDKVSSLGSGHDHVMDAISECEQVVRSKGKKEEEANWRLFYRKEMFSPWYEPSKDPIASDLIYKQLCRGVRTGEYPCDSDEDLVFFLAHKLYIDEGKDILPGKIQQELPAIVPIQKYKDGVPKSLTQTVLNCLGTLAFVKAATPAEIVRRKLLKWAMKTWTIHFSGLFEAYQVAGPPLPKSEVVLAVNGKGLYIMNEPFEVTVGFPFYEVVDGFSARSEKYHSTAFTVVTIKGEEYSFLSPNAETIARLVTTCLDGLRRRSMSAIGLQEFELQGEGVGGRFHFKQGDYVEILSEREATSPLREGWVMGRCGRTKTKGPFPFDAVYLIPTLDIPPPEFFYMFKQLTAKEFDTLPRKKGAVVLSKDGTIGRDPDHGKDSNA